MDPKECNANTAGKTGELHLQAVRNYIHDWVTHIPETMPDMQLPIPIQELVTTLDGNNQDTILWHIKAEKRPKRYKSPPQEA